MKEFRNIPFDVVRPKEFPEAKILWTFDQDDISRSIAQRLGFYPGVDILAMVAAGCNRESAVLKRLLNISGRSANFTLDRAIRLINAPYDTLQIGGFGNQPQDWRYGSIGTVVKDAPIDLPSTKNFAKSHPGIVRVDIINKDGKVETLEDPYSFTGAYTRKQALEKVSANLYILETILDQAKPLFTVPIPIGIGYYPKIVNEWDQHAYFIAWITPYKGRRTGVPDTSLKRQDAIQYYETMIQTSPLMAPVFRSFHDTTGLTHNQTVPGNFYVPPEGGTPLLADFSTVYPISQKNIASARARDLWKMILSIVEGVSQTFPSYDASQVMHDLYSSTHLLYLGASIPDPSSGIMRIDQAIEYKIKLAIEQGIIPKETPAVFAESRMEVINREISRSLSVD